MSYSKRTHQCPSCQSTHPFRAFITGWDRGNLRNLYGCPACGAPLVQASDFAQLSLGNACAGLLIYFGYILLFSLAILEYELPAPYFGLFILIILGFRFEKRGYGVTHFKIPEEPKLQFSLRALLIFVLILGILPWVYMQFGGRSLIYAISAIFLIAPVPDVYRYIRARLRRDPSSM